MAKTPTTTKTPRYIVLGDQQVSFITSSTTVANEKVIELQKLNNPLITITDIKYETTYEYSKNNHQKNYRIRSVAFLNPNVKTEEYITDSE